MLEKVFLFTEEGSIIFGGDEMYRYETHLHTKPVSHCARATVRETLEFYKALGYAGVFITNHFLDGNINVDVRGWDYQRQIEYFCSDYEEGIKIGKELGISVFFGAELSYGGSDFLVIREFFECIAENKQPFFDVYCATTMASVAILSHRSILERGVPYDIPDFHKEEDLFKYENDTLSPFYGDNGEEPTLPCCSHPDFKPSNEEKEKYKSIIS